MDSEGCSAEWLDDLQKIKDAVDAAREEISMAVGFHETWKPTAFDENLHARMGNSYATHSFQIVRMSLRREMLLALMRIWDSNQKSIRMSLVLEKLRQRGFFECIIALRQEEAGLLSASFIENVRQTLVPHREAAIGLIAKYSKGGSGFDLFNKLKALRHERLAHRQIAQESGAGFDASDQEIECFYQDTLALVQHLLSLVWATSVDFSELADLYRFYAKFFWENARGERTEGHPNFRPQTQIQ